MVYEYDTIISAYLCNIWCGLYTKGVQVINLILAVLLVIASVIASAVLYRKGGDGSGKLYRRLGIPVLITFINWLTGVNWWWLALPVGFTAFSLPITLFGDDIHKDWRNWAWLPILGALIGLMLLTWWKIIVFTVCFTVFTVLSNVKKTAEIFKWQFIEYFLGALIGILVCFTR